MCGRWYASITHLFDLCLAGKGGDAIHASLIEERDFYHFVLPEKFIQERMHFVFIGISTRET